MAYFVIPHHVKRRSARIWVCRVGESLSQAPKGVSIEYGGGIYTISDNKWRKIDGGRNNRHFHYRWVSLSRLTPDTHYALKVKRLGRVVARGAFDTLPMGLQKKSVKSRPFTVLLGSCFHSEDDGGRVGEAYNKLYKSKLERPHVKFLVGDQVYLDQPPNGFAYRQSTAWLRKHFANIYYDSWNKLKSLLSHSGNILISDDHEFWNDYPEPPLAAWGTLSTSSGFRETYEKMAIEYLNIVQGARSTFKFDIGNHLSFFVADTRRNRTRGDNGVFMRQDDLDKLEKWCSTLRSPGVLVLGQPLFFKAKGKWGPFTSDKNLLAYRQYKEVIKALATAEHDIVVLSGDVHFGRIASTILNRKKGGSTKVIEIISSPMSLLSTDGEGSRSIATKSYPQFPGLPSHLPYFPFVEIKGIIPSRVKFHKSVDFKRRPRKMDQFDRTAENFMTLQFTRKGTNVELEVKAWLVRRKVTGSLPALNWSWKTTLSSIEPGSYSELSLLLD